MSRLRFSLTAVMVFTLIAAIGFAALRSASKPVALATYIIVCGVFLAAAVAAFRYRGRRRAACLGIVIGGVVYLVAAFAPWFESRVAPWLVTTGAVERLNAQLEPPRKLSEPDVGVAISQVWLRSGIRGAFGTVPAVQSIERISDETVLQASIDPRDSILWVTGGDQGGVADIELTVQGGARRVLRVAVGPDQRDRRQQIAHLLTALLVAALGGLLVLVLWRKEADGTKPDGTNGS